MNIIIEPQDTLIRKPEIEKVEQERQEYYLLGTFQRTRGLKLFGYNFIKNELFEVEIKHRETLNLIPTIDGTLKSIDAGAKCTVDSRNTYFEALNFASASNRLKNYQSGKIKELSNLKKPSEGIKFF